MLMYSRGMNTPTPGLRARFVTKAPRPIAATVMAEIRDLFADLAEEIDGIAPDGREKALAMTNLEQAKYWANQAVILEDNRRAGDAE